VARSKKRSFKRRGPRADWVYRDDGLGLSTGGTTIFAQDNLGSYSPEQAVCTSEQSIAFVLYDSHNYMRAMTHGGLGASAGALGAAARATGRRPSCRWVRGLIVVDTSGWSVNDELVLGLRIGVFQQDAADGFIEVDPAYTMFAEIVAGEPPTMFANQQRANQWERRFYRRYGDQSTAGLWTIPISTRVRARLSDDECLAIYAQVDDGSVNAYITPWLSTLVSDEA